MSAQLWELHARIEVLAQQADPEAFSAERFWPDGDAKVWDRGQGANMFFRRGRARASAYRELFPSVVKASRRKR